MRNDQTAPRVSILMAVWNAERWLPAAIGSVLAQTSPHWQLICVDDASTDNSLQLLRSYAARDPRILVLSQPHNQGQAVARNEALLHATGEFVMMLDADDWLSQDCVEKIEAAFDHNPTADCVVLSVIDHWESAPPGEHRSAAPTAKETPYPMPFKPGDTLSGYEAFLLSLDWTIHGLYAVRRQIHQANPYDTTCRLYSDDNTTRLHYLRSRRVVFTCGTYYYRHHAESRTTAITADRFLYMRANLSMMRQLEVEDLPPEVLQRYDRHRWLNYIDQHWLYFRHGRKLTTAERQTIRRDLRQVYSTFSPQSDQKKFGYCRLGSYRLFLVQEWLYFSLKKLLRR